MNDDTNLLSADEAKYFETKGQADLPLPADDAGTDAAADKEAEKALTEKPAIETVKEEKAPAQIEIASEDEIDAEEPDARKYVKVGVVRKEREEKKQLRLRAEQAEQGRAALEQRLRALEQPQRELEPAEVVQQTANELRQIKGALAN